MKLWFVASLILFSASASFAEDPTCFAQDDADAVDVLSENVCTVTARSIVDGLDDERKQFEEIYSGKKSKGYQDKLIGQASTIESRAQKNNYELWMSALDKKLLESTFPTDENGNWLKEKDPNGPGVNSERLIAPDWLVEVIKKSKDLKGDKADEMARYHIERNISYYIEKGSMVSSNGSIMSKSLRAYILNLVMNDPAYSDIAQELKNNVTEAIGSTSTINEQMDHDFAYTQVQQILSDEAAKKPSARQKDYWSQKYTEEQPFVAPDSQASQVHYTALVDYRQEMQAKYEKKIAGKAYQNDPGKLKQAEREHQKELDSIQFDTPKKISFLPPEGVDIDEFYAKIAEDNPAYFNCRISYSADAKAKDQISKENESKSQDDAGEVIEIQTQAKTCQLDQNFDDDQYQLKENMKTEVDECLASIPSNAKNVKIEIESCASTVRTNKEEFAKSNLNLSRKRSESLASLIPTDKNYQLELNYFGQNKMIDGSGKLMPTGTCGPWVQSVGDWHMNPASCINSIKLSTNYCSNTPENMIKLDGFYWLCNQIEGAYTKDVKASLEQYRYNKIKITYDMEPIKNQNKDDPSFDPARLPQRERLAYIETQPHITCLAPRLRHQNFKSLQKKFEDFALYLSELKFPAVSISGGNGGGGQSYVKPGKLCAAYH